MSNPAMKRCNQSILPVPVRPCRAVRDDSCRSRTRRPPQSQQQRTPRTAGGGAGCRSAPRSSGVHQSSRSRTRTRHCWMTAVILVLATAAMCVVASGEASRPTHQTSVDQATPPVSTHTSNFAVIVSSSRYWFNYRHVINALSIYQLVRSNGIPDDRIVLMLADEYAVNPRNPLPNQLLAMGRTGPTLYDETIQVDYRGDDVRVESFLRVLTGRRRHSCDNGDNNDYNSTTDQQCEDEGYGPVLDSDRDSNVLIYLTGHGGDNFFKFQDAEEVLAAQLGAALNEMHARNMYRHVLLMADTCQAFTLGDAVTAPNVTVLGSSLRGESSYAHHSDDTLGLSVIERYTHALIEFVNGQPNWRDLSLRRGLVDPYPYETQRAHVGVKEDTSELTMDQLTMRDFFVGANLPDDEPTVVLIPDDDPILFVPSLSRSPDAERLSFERGVESQCPLEASPRTTGERLGDQAEGARRGTSWLGRMSSSFLTPSSLEPTDPLFVGMVTVLLGSVAWSSASTRYR